MSGGILHRATTLVIASLHNIQAVHHAMASAACGLACRNLRLTAPRLRAGLRTPLRLRAVNEKSQMWTWASRERIGGVDGGLER